VDGRVLHLGSHAIAHGPPFFRQHGPDLMGIFLSDVGALGIKTRVTLRAIPLATLSEHLSFAFGTSAETFEAMAIVARLEAASECYAFDATLQNMVTKSAGLGADLKVVGGVIKAAGLVKGIGIAARLAVAGRRFLKDVNYSLHISLDAGSAAEARLLVSRISKALAGRGRKIDASIPRMIRLEPFAEVTGMLGPSGERWVNVHGIVAFSQAAAMLDACNAVVSRHAALIDQYHIATGYLMCGVGMSGILIEPVIYWPDAREAFHNRVLPHAHLATLKSYPRNAGARDLVQLLRRELATAFLERGAVSFQLGKFYDYRRALDPSAFDDQTVLGPVGPDELRKPGTWNKRRSSRYRRQLNLVQRQVAGAGGRELLVLAADIDIPADLECLNDSGRTECLES
jgi:D-lactate dehydrogenase (cytochrome)